MGRTDQPASEGATSSTEGACGYTVTARTAFRALRPNPRCLIRGARSICSPAVLAA